MGWQRRTSPPARRQKRCRRRAAEEEGLRPAPPVGRPRPFLRWRRPLPPPMPLSAVRGAGRKEVATSGDEVTPRGFWSAPSMPTTSFPSRRSPLFPSSPLVAGLNVPPPVAVHLSPGPRPSHCLVEPPRSMPRERWGGGGLAAVDPQRRRRGRRRHCRAGGRAPPPGHHHPAPRHRGSLSRRFLPRPTHPLRLHHHRHHPAEQRLHHHHRPLLQREPLPPPQQAGVQDQAERVLGGRPGVGDLGRAASANSPLPHQPTLLLLHEPNVPGYAWT